MHPENRSKPMHTGVIIIIPRNIYAVRSIEIHLLRQARLAGSANNPPERKESWRFSKQITHRVRKVIERVNELQIDKRRVPIGERALK